MSLINYVLSMALGGLVASVCLAIVVCAFGMFLDILEEHKDLWRKK